MLDNLPDLTLLRVDLHCNAPLESLLISLSDLVVQRLTHRPFHFALGFGNLEDTDFDGCADRDGVRHSDDPRGGHPDFLGALEGEAVWSTVVGEFSGIKSAEGQSLSSVEVLEFDVVEILRLNFLHKYGGHIVDVVSGTTGESDQQAGNDILWILGLVSLAVIKRAPGVGSDLDAAGA